MLDNHGKPIRILQAVGSMDRAGAETWLMHILRHIDRDMYKIDFLVHATRDSAYDEEIRSLGSNIIPCVNIKNPILYERDLGRILREHGPYDVVHSHLNYFSGLVLRAAEREGVPISIAHSHTAFQEDGATILRRLYLRQMGKWIGQYSTHKLAVSREAAKALFGEKWESDPRCKLMYCGVDLEPFAVDCDRADARGELGIPEDALVLGHVGRFLDVKNHRLVVKIANEVIGMNPDAWLVLVGDGPLRPAIQQQVAEYGISDRVVFMGNRPDVPRIMKSVLDVLVFPSLYEGLPLTIVEAQAAGLPAVISDVITEEADVVKPLVNRCNLAQGERTWAESVLSAWEHPTIGREESLALVRSSPFDIGRGVSAIERLYAGGDRH